MICTATSVLPVPGGPTTSVSPGCMPERMASTWVEVKGTAFLWGKEEEWTRRLRERKPWQVPLGLVVGVGASAGDGIGLYNENLLVFQKLRPLPLLPLRVFSLLSRAFDGEGHVKGRDL